MWSRKFLIGASYFPSLQGLVGHSKIQVLIRGCTLSSKRWDHRNVTRPEESNVFVIQHFRLGGRMDQGASVSVTSL